MQWQSRNQADQRNIPPSLSASKVLGTSRNNLQGQHLLHPQPFSANFHPFPTERITKSTSALFLIVLFALLSSSCKDWSWLVPNPKWIRRNQESWEDLQGHGIKGMLAGPGTPSSGLGAPVLLRLGFRGEAASALGGLNPTFPSPEGIMTIPGKAFPTLG